MKIQNIPTPALIVDKTIFDKNALAMKELLKNSKLKLRPHYKSHKCADIARMQVEGGAVGLTCAKLDEAIDLIDSGIENVLIANQIVDPSKIAKLAYLAKCCKLAVCVDNEQNAVAISNACKLAGSTVYLLIEYEVGMERCGIANKEDILALAKVIKGLDNVEFEGIQAYAGHISHVESLEDRRLAIKENYAKISELIGYLSKNGIEVKTLSGGSTGTSVIKAKEGLYTELQAGSYLFMDSTYSELNLPFENSLFILSTVVSVNGNIAVVDAGVKSCGVDQGMPKCVGFETKKIVASEEHFQLHFPSKKLKVGDKVLLIPGHCCSTVNLHDKIYFVKDDKALYRVPITARGCSK